MKIVAFLPSTITVHITSISSPTSNSNDRTRPRRLRQQTWRRPHPPPSQRRPRPDPLKYPAHLRLSPRRRLPSKRYRQASPLMDHTSSCSSASRSWCQRQRHRLHLLHQRPRDGCSASERCYCCQDAKSTLGKGIGGRKPLRRA